MNTTSKGNFIIKRTINEFLLIVLTILALFSMSTHFKPLMISATLSPDGQGQGGWPLPFSSSYWDDMGMNSYQAQGFNLGTFTINVLIFYALIRIVMSTMEGVIYRYNSQQYKKLVAHTAKRIAIMMVFLGLVYGVYVLRESIINAPREVFPVVSIK